MPHPDYLDKVLTASQWQDWLNFDSLEMIGNEQYREELRHGQKLAQYANYHNDWKKNRVGHSHEEFMNFYEKPEVKVIEMTPEQTQAYMDKQVFGL